MMRRKIPPPTPQQDAIAWVQNCTGQAGCEGTGTAPLAAWLKDGTVLCALVNALRPGLARTIRRSDVPFNFKESRRCQLNISAFLAAVRSLGVQPSNCFETADLYDENDVAQVVRTILALRTAVRKNGAATQHLPYGSLLDSDAEGDWPQQATHRRVQSLPVVEPTSSQIRVRASSEDIHSTVDSKKKKNRRKSRHANLDAVNKNWNKIHGSANADDSSDLRFSGTLSAICKVLVTDDHPSRTP
jgi:hypothetical protein